MQISEAWLRELTNPAISTSELAEQLTMAGLEVDSVRSAGGEFSKVVVGRVVSAVQHPNADKLRLCQVQVGEGDSLQIVCGADNVRQGLLAPLALVGAVLSGKHKIKQSKLRGELSQGMLCSEEELGLQDSADGIMELADDAPVGADLRDYLALDDNIIDLDLTPNRADCLSVEGVAREVAALNKSPYTPTQFTPSAVTTNEQIAIQVVARQACPRYLGRLIKNVDPLAATPVWMQEKLRRCGVRSLGVLVDVSNYVLLELGHPLHVFDADKICGDIVIRYASNNEQLQLLNQQTISLDEQTLVVADQKQALALAGIMGGASSAVDFTTKNIFLEAAFFAPTAIAGKARQFGLHTDASHRFERGVDFALQERAVDRATQLIVDLAGGVVGSICQNTSTEYLPSRPAIELQASQVQKVLGVAISAAEIAQILGGLGMQVLANAEGWSVTPPSYRFDIAIAVDLIEEISRIYGYNRLPNSDLLMRTQLTASTQTAVPSDNADLLVAKGYQEVITYSFVDEAMQLAFAPNEQLLHLQNPISAEMAVMRSSLCCGLLSTALYNLNRQQTRLQLFEIGQCFSKKDGEIVQQNRVAGLAYGTAYGEQWGKDNRAVDFFDSKGVVDSLLASGKTSAQYRPSANPALHPGQAADIIDQHGATVGFVGMLHPKLEQQFGFANSVFLFEIATKALQHKPVADFQPLSKFPSVRRDIALVVAKNISAAEIIGCIRDCGIVEVRQVLIFDVYSGVGVGEGYKSVALGITLQNLNRTLADSEIDAIFNSLLAATQRTIGAKLRK